MLSPPSILWEDAHGLAVDKPAGMLTQKGGASRDEPTLEGAIRSYLAPSDPAAIYLGTVHRLDRPVSGVILWAKTPRAARRWAEQFGHRRVFKEYWALVEAEGLVPGQSGQWVDWLSAPDLSGRSRVVPDGTAGSAKAVTSFEVGRSSGLPGGLAWLKLRPETGRTHQLRAQAAARGTPVVGDRTYGASQPFAVGIALHSRTLTVDHPIIRRPLTLEAPLPASWGHWPGN